MFSSLIHAAPTVLCPLFYDFAGSTQQISKWNRWQKGATLFLPLIREEQSWFPFLNWCTRGSNGQNHSYYDKLSRLLQVGDKSMSMLSALRIIRYFSCSKWWSTETSAFGMVNITVTGLYEKRRSEPLLETVLSIKMQNRLQCWPAVKRPKMQILLFSWWSPYCVHFFLLWMINVDKQSR